VKNNEVDMIVKLVWKLVAAFGIVLIIMLTTMGGSFLFLVGADAGQAKQFSEELDKKADKELMIAMSIENNIDHQTFSEIQREQGSDISNIRSNVSEINANIRILLEERSR
jgi:hypothetical protein